MKTQFLFIAILFTFTSKAQTWFPIGTTWYYDQVSIDNAENHGYIKYEVVSDTLIDTIQAQVVSIEAYDFDGTKSQNDSSLIVYEKNEKVYHYNDNDQFELRYDFSLGLGDTSEVKRTLTDCNNSSPLVVDSIWVDTLDGQTFNAHRVTFSYEVVFGIKFDYSEIVYQGIGTIQKNALTSTIQCANIDAVINQSPLRCYSVNGNTYHTNDWIENGETFPCDTLINKDQLNSYEISTQVKMYPNPIQNKLNIQLDQKVKSLEIINTQGQIVLQESNPQKLININTSQLKKGVYFVNLTQFDQQRISLKIIK